MSNARDLVKVSRLFYLDSLSQKEISEKLGISRPQVCRMLQEARNQGIVKITIDSPFDREDYLAEKLERIFGLRTVYVYKTLENERDESFYKQCVRDLTPFFKKYSRIAVMSGRTLWGIACMLPDTVKTGNSFVPLAGISGSRGQSFQANEIAREMAMRAGGSFATLNTPLLVRNPDLGRLLYQDPGISEILEEGRNADLALVGIGSVDENSGSYRSGAYLREDIDVLRSQGIVGSMCCSFFDREGAFREPEISRRLIGIRISEFRHAVVWAFAGDAADVGALSGALRTRRVNSLSVTEATAEALLKFSGEP
ncbi:sugar-binding transcriptional regulator [Succinimonas amylolytica]|uniref:sugar-binding transcriptional regulator n=1 Tax=Succinimonas amylolytica TaxID=83769 RepID=UPI0023A87125